MLNMKQVRAKQLQEGDRILGPREFIRVLDGQFVVVNLASATVKAKPQPIALGQWEVPTNKGILRMSGESLLRIKPEGATLTT